MEPGLAAAAYGVETVAEGAIGAAVAVAQPTMAIKARWTRIPIIQSLASTSHSLSIVKGRAYIFGGEIVPRRPVDNEMHIITIPSSGVAEADYQVISGKDVNAPSPRFGHTATVISDRIFIFGGRGGNAKEFLQENGRVWIFNTTFNAWSHIDPAEGSPHPKARSYHASAATEHPLTVKSGTDVEFTGSDDSQDHGSIFIHGGCSASRRMADVWMFDVAARFWSKLPDAPGAPRGGPGLAFSRDRLYRFGGFDGEKELGGQIDYLQMAKATFDNKGGRGELALVLRSGKWETIDVKEGDQAPGNRSVAGLHTVTTGQGRNYLILLLGERSPSSNGHDGAGQFWDDVWSYQLRPDGMTAASFKDAARQLVGAKTSEGSWAPVRIPDATMENGKLDHPGPRGWFASAQADMDKASIVLWGGLNSENQRQGDGWILTFDV